MVLRGPVTLAGAVENANKRLRRWLCRDTDPNDLSRHERERLCARLNSTPRKCPGFRTPAEVFKANLLGRGHRRAKLSTQRPHGRIVSENRLGQEDMVADGIGERFSKAVVLPTQSVRMERARSSPSRPKIWLWR